jgi:hypothetical protein
MIYVQPICLKCIHYFIETSTCKAFPNGIPDEIYLGENHHLKPLQGQQNDIVFEALKSA